MTTIWSRLRFHVAGLAKSYEVRSLVSLFRSRKLPKRADMIHRKAGPDVLSAVGTISILLCDHHRPNLPPPSSAVRLRSSDPVRRVLSRAVFPPVFGFTLKRAELAAVTVSQTPCLLLEFRPALSARQNQRRDVHRIVRPEHHRRSRVLSWVPSYSVHTRNVIHPQACPGAETSAATGGLRWANQHLLAANFTGFLNHVRTIPRFGGARTTNLNPEYAALARERINTDAGLFAPVSANFAERFEP